MALNANGRLLALLPLRFRGGATLSFEVFDSNTSGLRNIYISENTDMQKSAAVPNGSSVESAWILPQSSGGISAYTTISGNTDLTGSGAMGLNALATLTGIGDVSGVASKIAALLASLIGTGDLSANVVASLSAAASLVGTGDFTGTVTALGNALSSLTGQGTVIVTPYASGTLAATISVSSSDPLSPANLAAAVWSEPYAAYTTTGTFGKLLQDAGGGSSPEVIASAVWDELLSTHTVSGTYGEKVKKLLTLSQFLALKDLSLIHI